MSRGFGRQALVLACFLFVSLVPLAVSAESELTGEHIEQFDVDITVGQSGEIDVAETIQYNFGTAERHGIYRDIPYEYAGQYGVKHSMPIDVQSVTDTDGEALRFEVSRAGGYLRVKIGDPNRFITGRETYVIRYAVQDTISYFSDYDELYWNVTGDKWTVPIVESAVTVHFPQAIPGGRSVCYFGPIGSTERCPISGADPSISTSGFRASASHALTAGSGMTIAIGFPKGIVRELTGTERFFRFLGQNPFVLLPFIVFGFMYRKWWREGRDPEGRGTIVPEYDVPEDLSPLHIAALQDGRLTGKEIPAAIIDLAVKGYLVIEQVTEGGLIIDTRDYRLTETAKQPTVGSIESTLLEAIFLSRTGVTAARVESTRAFLASSQSRFLPGFLRRSIEAALPKESEATTEPLRSVKVSELKNKFYAKIPELQKRAVADLVARRYFTRSPQEIWGKYALWGFLIFFASFFILPMLQLEGLNVIAFLACIPIYIVFAWLMPRVTREGAVMKERLLGLKDYLQIAEKRRIEFHNAPEKTPALFEKLLPAALLLGVSDIWAKEFSDITMIEPKWYRSGRIHSFSATSFVSDLGGFHSAAAASLASAPSSSGSGGGGFSGGGGGGGGGGSW